MTTEEILETTEQLTDEQNDKEFNHLLHNPKHHDALFKWLISAFTEEFFAHYFPSVKIGKYR